MTLRINMQSAVQVTENTKACNLSATMDGQGEGETEQPGQPGEGEAEQPGQPGEGETEQPEQPGEGETEQPGQPGEGGTEQPAGPAPQNDAAV